MAMLLDIQTVCADLTKHRDYSEEKLQGVSQGRTLFNKCVYYAEEICIAMQNVNRTCENRK